MIGAFLASARGPSSPLDLGIDVSAKFLNKIKNSASMVDVAALRGDGSQIKFTHFQLTSKAHLDRIYTSAELSLQVSNYVVEPEFYSDHCYVEVLVGRRPIQKGDFNWDLWKRNITFLRAEFFVFKTTEMLNKTAECDLTEAMYQWERLKEDIKLLAFERSGELHRQAKAEEEALQSALRYLCKL